MSGQTILITGGCRSGKSRHALELGEAFSGKKIYLATAEAFDDEMKSRVQKHREERGKNWTTVEEPLNPAQAIRKQNADVIILDCLTLWISNCLMKDLTAGAILEKTGELIAECRNHSATIIVVTNEVGGGIVPENKLARDFRDIVGEANQTMAKAFDQVIQTVSGIPVKIKSPVPESGDVSRASENEQEFSPEKKRGLYEAIFKRRDIRHFNSRPVDPEKLGRILKAAHHAGSVGYMQPWNFLVIEEPGVKQRVAEIFNKANKAAGKHYDGDRAELYHSLKLEGITDAPVNICVTCDRERFGPNTLGRDTMPEMDLYSAVCAVQNLWLSARAEGLGVGWVSILDPEELKKLLGIPEKIQPVAYLCVGHTDKFYEEPMLETAGWEKRLGLESLIFYNQWNGQPDNWKVRLPEDTHQ